LALFGGWRARRPKETTERSTALASSFKGKKTAIVDMAREVKREATAEV
jgi:hypothetical protein